MSDAMTELYGKSKYMTHNEYEKERKSLNKAKELGFPTYEIHLNSFLRLSELGYEGDFDVMVTIPNCKGLDEAVCLINKQAKVALERQNKLILETKLLEAKSRLDKASGTEVRDILNDLVEYGKSLK